MCSIGDWPCGPVPIFASRYRSQHRGLALAACPRLLRRIQARGYSPARFALKPRYEQVTSTLIASAAVPPRDRQQVPVPDAQKPVDLAASGLALRACPHFRFPLSLAASGTGTRCLSPSSTPHASPWIQPRALRAQTALRTSYVNVDRVRRGPTPGQAASASP